MKVCLLLATLLGLYHHATVEAAQSQCTSVKAVELTDAVLKLITSTTWWTDVVTKMKTKPEGFDPAVNTCSTVSYAEGCEAIRTTSHVDPNNNKVRIVHTYAYSSVTKNIVFYEEKFEQIEPDHAVFQGKITKMGYIQDPSSGVVDSPINPMAQTVQSQMFATTYVEPSGAFLIYRTCNTSGDINTWVQVSQEVVDQKQVVSWRQSINEKLSELGVTADQLADPEENFPFNVPIPTF